MGTVVITFFIIVQFCVFKMDDDSSESLRISQRDDRWSMNSQRLESIVAELLKPIGDIRRSFDTDLSALLEEYLTEAGLRALDEEDHGTPSAIPNFAELALLLQQSASVYSRKVDFLYQHVLSVSDSLQQSTQEIDGATSSPAEGQAEAATPARRKRKASGAPEGFRELVLQRDGATRRERSARPPPTLPRMYVELEPRAPCDADAPLLDYAGEPVGLLADFHVAWRLRDGTLVEELQRGAAPAPALRPVPLLELSEAIAAAGPLSPPPLPARGSPSPPPACRSPSPLAAPAAPDAPDAPQLDAASAPPPAEARRERKRRSEVAPEDALDGPLKLTISDATRRKLQRVQEFSVPDTWLRRVVQRRARAVLDLRRELRAQRDRAEEKEGFRGFDASPADCGPEGGFPGWSGAGGAAGAGGAGTQLAARRPDDSDDDGFFEQSSFGDSDASRVDECSPPACGAPEWSSWRARVVARASEAEARGRDVQGAAATLLGACEALPSPAPFPALLARVAQRPDDVSELFLATLFLANAGNVEIVPGAPLSVDSFSVRLLSSDQRLYRAALQQPAHEQHQHA